MEKKSWLIDHDFFLIDNVDSLLGLRFNLPTLQVVDAVGCWLLAYSMDARFLADSHTALELLRGVFEDLGLGVAVSLLFGEDGLILLVAVSVGEVNDVAGR